MAIIKTVTASASYIVLPSGAMAYTFPCRPDVSLKVFNSTYTTAASFATSNPTGLIPPVRITLPGVFTAGTAQEGTLSNPNNDSNN